MTLVENRLKWRHSFYEKPTDFGTDFKREADKNSY